MKRTRTLLLALFSGVCFASHCEATVYNSDGSAQNVQYVHDNLAQDGDTITLPAGTFIWTSGVTISKAITIQGTGIGSTIIKDDVQNFVALISFTLRPSLLSRLTGIEFQDGGRNVYNNVPGYIHIDGSNTNGSQFRLDHNRTYHINGNIGP